MKLQILLDEKDSIEGYVPIDFRHVQEELTQVPANSCESIVAVKMMNLIPVQSIESFFDLLLSKLRINGELIISGIEQKVLAKYMLNDTVSDKEFNRILESTNSMITLSDATKLLEVKGLKVRTTNMNGVEYGVTAVRS